MERPQNGTAVLKGLTGSNFALRHALTDIKLLGFSVEHSALLFRTTVPFYCMLLCVVKTAREFISSQEISSLFRLSLLWRSFFWRAFSVRVGTG